MHVLKVKEVAKIAGISVRTLRYYDEVGLLRPYVDPVNQYRYYQKKDLKRLWEILFLKELGFSIEQIRSFVESNITKQNEFLSLQKEELIMRKRRIDQMIDSVEQIQKKGFETNMLNDFNLEDIKKHQKKYEEEAKSKWGNTSAYKESNRRSKSYDAKTWETIGSESNAIYQGLAKLMDQPVDHQDVQALVKQWQDLISKYFYPCDNDMLRGLGQMYISDNRFTINIDKTKEGLANFMHLAIEHYCNHV